MGSLSPILDVVIGMCAVYVAFSLLASWCNEQIASLLKRRAKFLVQGLEQLLNGNATALNAFFSDPMFKTMLNAGGAKDDFVAKTTAAAGAGLATATHVLTAAERAALAKIAPSYLSAQQFSAIVMNLFSKQIAGPNAAGVAAAAAAAPPAAVSAAGAAQALPPAFVTAVQTAASDLGLADQANAMLLRSEGDVDKFVTSLETWYDDHMDRVSGWYTRRTRTWLAIIGLVLAAGMNVDSIRVYDGLRCSTALRGSVAALSDAAKAQDAHGSSTFVAALVNAIPLGWPDATIKCDTLKPVAVPAVAFTPEFGGYLVLKILGLAITAIALTLGAPFWFDALSTITRVRMAGKKPDAPQQK